MIETFRTIDRLGYNVEVMKSNKRIILIIGSSELANIYNNGTYQVFRTGRETAYRKRKVEMFLQKYLKRKVRIDD